MVLPYFETDEGAIAVVGSRGGMKRDPHWARNLRAEPRARIHRARRGQDVTARLVSGDERARLWRTICQRSPIYVTYQERAAAFREIPVFVLEGANAP